MWGSTRVLIEGRTKAAGAQRSTWTAPLLFNLADLFYVVAHEAFPGHIAESVLKDDELVRKKGRVEHQIRFMISSTFVISEGLGLHAQSLIFPADEAQEWMAANVFNHLGVKYAPSNLAAIHEARNMLWGAWGNAALLAADGGTDERVANYLSGWALLGDTEATWAIDFLKSPGMRAYVLGYYHGWRLLSPGSTIPSVQNVCNVC